MLQLLLHSSKTMRPLTEQTYTYQSPRLLYRSKELASYIRSLDVPTLAVAMKLSVKKAEETAELFANWTADTTYTRPAIDEFIGDIYSGLQVRSLSEADRKYANEHLLILSGLYGGLRALDSVAPYRLEMAYRLPDKPYDNLYRYWGDSIARLISKETSYVINLSAVEYTKAVLPYYDGRVITPKFLTISPKTGVPTFVTVHAKIARGAFAHWLLVQRIDGIARLYEYTDLGYAYDGTLSTPTQPVFVCSEFGGLGLSVRLT